MKKVKASSKSPAQAGRSRPAPWPPNSRTISSSASGPTTRKPGSPPPTDSETRFLRFRRNPPGSQPPNNPHLERSHIMKSNVIIPGSQADRVIVYSDAEKIARRALGLPACEPAPGGLIKRLPKGRKIVSKKNITEQKVLNEPSEYGAAFVRGLGVDLPGGVPQLLFSGTASIGPNGETLYPGDFRAQLWRTYFNLTGLLASEGATRHDMVRTPSYLRDIERDYGEFNSIRNEF